MRKKLIACKACGREIATSAAVCPQCGKTRTTRERLVMLAVIALVLFAIAGLAIKGWLANMEQGTDEMIRAHGLNPKDYK